MLRVLVADHDDGARQRYAAWLADAGYEVSQAGHGAAALALAVESDCHVVLMEALLPVLSGVEVIKRLRAQKLGVHIIVVSAGAPDIPADVALMTAGMFGVDRLFYKPLDRYSLLAAVADADSHLAVGRELAALAKSAAVSGLR